LHGITPADEHGVGSTCPDSFCDAKFVGRIGEIAVRTAHHLVRRPHTRDSRCGLLDRAQPASEKKQSQPWRGVTQEIRHKVRTVQIIRKRSAKLQPARDIDAEPVIEDHEPRQHLSIRIIASSQVQHVRVGEGDTHRPAARHFPLDERDGILSLRGDDIDALKPPLAEPSVFLEWPQIWRQDDVPLLP
jgi:hypothetical protein